MYCQKSGDFGKTFRRDEVAGELVRACWCGIEPRGQLFSRLDARGVRQEPPTLGNLAGIMGGAAEIALPGRCEIASMQIRGALLVGNGLAPGYLRDIGSIRITYQFPSGCGCSSFQRFGGKGQEVATGNSFEVFPGWQEGPGLSGQV